MDYDEMIRVEYTMAFGAMRKWPKWAYPDFCLFELNAGSGKTNGGDGTALIALRAALDARIPIRAWLFEKNSANADELERHVAKLGFDSERVRGVRGDHNQTSPAIAAELKRLHGAVYGVVVADPTKMELPTDIIHLLAHAPIKSRIDVFAYAQPGTIKRVRIVWGGGRFMESLRAVGLPLILLRQPHGQAQWTWAVLTRWAGYPELRKIGFRRVGTPEGDALVERLDSTIEEWRADHQSVLPFDLSDPIEA